MQIGKLIQQSKGFKAFIPNSFPPKDGFKLSSDVIKKANKATLLLGKLDGITQLLPDVDFFLFMYIRKDASSSSQIEGTQATMMDALEAEANTETINNLPKDVDDILHYISALNYGLRRLKDFPMSLRVIKEIHKELMKDARITHFSDPGNFRNSQNWIGGSSPSNASFVPPPVDDMHRALADLEIFLHKEDELYPIIKAGIIHAQFEMIHPFLDGNGRTGRILITFYFWLHKLLEKPVLFLSSYFKKNQKLYYQRLNDYHEGDINKWLDFFLEGICQISEEAIETVKKITKLREEDILKIQSLGKTESVSAIKILPKLFELPIVNVSKIQEWTGFTRQGAQKVIDRFVRIGILEQKDKHQRYGRSFIYKKYVNIFED